MNQPFWYHAEKLIGSSQFVVDQPKGSQNPALSEVTYPLDYGYLVGTNAADGRGVDCWLGSLPGRTVTGAIMTIDPQTQRTAIKLLLNCSRAEADLALQVDQTGSQGAQLIWR